MNQKIVFEGFKKNQGICENSQGILNVDMLIHGIYQTFDPLHSPLGEHKIYILHW